MPAESRIEQLLRSWKEAEQSARESELVLYRAYAHYATGDGPGPSEQMKAQAAALRSKARCAYQAAMAEVDHVLEEADRRLRRP